jgi:hypothetical protein
MIVVAAGEAFLLLGPSDDRAGGVFMGVLVIVGSVLVAAVASALERQLAQP